MVGYECFGFNGMMSNYGFSGILFSWILNSLLIIALILLIVWLIQKMKKNENGASKNK